MESVTLDNNSLTLTEGDTGSLNVSVNPDNATDKTVVWTSSDESVATVDQNGVVTAVAPGSAVITASAGGKSDSCEVTVQQKPIEITGVEFEKDNVSIEVGSSDNLTVTITPEGAGDDIDRVFTSSDESIVTVDEDGKITGIAPGTATITVTIGDFTATCTITVTEKQSGNPDDSSSGSGSNGSGGSTQTGDFGTPLAGLLAAGSLCAAAMLMLRKRRR